MGERAAISGHKKGMVIYRIVMREDTSITTEEVYFNPSVAKAAREDAQINFKRLVADSRKAYTDSLQ